MEYEDNALSELDESQESENLEGEFAFELDQDTAKEAGTSSIQSELESLDQRFAKRLEGILTELSSSESEEGSDISANFSQQFNDLAREMDMEYFSLWSAAKKWGKKLAPLIAPGVPLLNAVTKLSPQVRRRIWGHLKSLGKQYLAKALPAVPGIGTAATIAGPILGKAGVPLFKDIFETAEGELESVSQFAEDLAKVAHEALEYTYENLEIDSVDPLKASELANGSLRHALVNLKHRGTTGGIITQHIPKEKVFYIRPGESVTIKFVGRQ